jgi:hypothetical protein
MPQNAVIPISSHSLVNGVRLSLPSPAQLFAHLGIARLQERVRKMVVVGQDRVERVNAAVVMKRAEVEITDAPAKDPLVETQHGPNPLALWNRLIAEYGPRPLASADDRRLELTHGVLIVFAEDLHVVDATLHAALGVKDPDRHLIGAGLVGDEQPNGRVADIRGTEAKRSVDEIDLALHAIAVDEQNDPGVRRVVVDPGDSDRAAEQAGGMARGAGAAFEVDVLAGQWWERRHPIRDPENPRPVRDGLPTHQYHGAVSRQRTSRNRTRSTSSFESGVAAATTQPNDRDAAISTRVLGARRANTSFSSRSCSTVFSPEASALASSSRDRCFSAARAAWSSGDSLTRAIVDDVIGGGDNSHEDQPGPTITRAGSVEAVRDNTRDNIHSVQGVQSV